MSAGKEYGTECSCGFAATLILDDRPSAQALADEVERQAREHAKACKGKQKTIGKRPR